MSEIPIIIFVFGFIFNINYYAFEVVRLCNLIITYLYKTHCLTEKMIYQNVWDEMRWAFMWVLAIILQYYDG